MGKRISPISMGHSAGYTSAANQHPFFFVLSPLVQSLRRKKRGTRRGTRRVPLRVPLFFGVRYTPPGAHEDTGRPSPSPSPTSTSKKENKSTHGRIRERSQKKQTAKEKDRHQEPGRPDLGERPYTVNRLYFHYTAYPVLRYRCNDSADNLASRS